MQTPPNPYEPPAARVSREDTGDVVVRPRGLAIAAIAVAALTLISAGIAPAQLKTFRELYSGFGAEIPWLSQVALGGAWVWSLLALAAIGIAAWIAGTRLGTRTTVRRMWLALVALAASFVFIFLVTVLALYLPIFRLGAVV